MYYLPHLEKDDIFLIKYGLLFRSGSAGDDGIIEKQQNHKPFFCFYCNFLSKQKTIITDIQHRKLKFSSLNIDDERELYL